MSKTGRVIIVGAGPVGIVCALALSKRGIPVTVFEQEASPVKDQWAASIHPPTLAMLDEIGITSRILDKGFISAKYRFHDRVDSSVVAEFDLDRMRDEFRFPFVLQYEQYKLTAAIYREYADGSDFDVRFSHRVSSLSQDASGVTVEVASPGGAKVYRADFVVGCDGGRSTVRKLANIEFKGFRYPEQFIKIATSFDFAEVNPHLVFRNYFSDPDEWCNLFKVRGEKDPGLWRAIFPMQPDEAEETALQPDRIEERLQRFFPKRGRYDIEYVSVYNVAQCVAATFRKGRVLLAGDSAHVNNPIGGMGMNGGIHDALNLAEKLAAVVHGAAGDETLDRYDRQRRYAAETYVQTQTIANKRLMEERDPTVRSRNFDELRRTAEDPERAKAYMRRASLWESLNSAAAIT
jgi:3-(3-hydroxy-phenyl)propionate hydroxylase